MKRWMSFLLWIGVAGCALEATLFAGSIPPAASSNHWAFQPIQGKEPASVIKNHEHPIDAFLGTSGATPAEARTLIRRMTYDLTGLPPTPQEVFAFEKEYSPTASATSRRLATGRLIDRLLSSSAYGEKWGRKWLDVVRYSDTAGENTDRPLRHAWRYRNYVIEAFNRDVPYDEFIREQIAGDLLSQEQPERFGELITATGYLAVARRFGHEVDKDIHLTYEDIIDTVGKSVLGLSLGCARCHDHKFDPVSSQDYYSWYGIFASTKLAYPGCEATQKVRDMVPLWSSEQMAVRVQPLEAVQAGLESEIRTSMEHRATFLKTLDPLATAQASALASGEFPDGGQSDLGSSGEPIVVLVNKGDCLRLTILPKANYGADTTRIDWQLEYIDSPDRRWNLAQDIGSNFLSGNPHAAGSNAGGLWCFLDGRKPFQLLTETVRDLQGKAGLHVWRSGDNPSAFVNSTDNPIQAWTLLPPRSFFVHPASDGPVAVAWISPVAGRVRMRGKVADGHAGGGDGVAWRLEHLSGDFGTVLTQVADNDSARSVLKQKLQSVLGQKPEVPLAYAAIDGKGADAVLQRRGDPEQPGGTVPRRNLTLLGGDALKDSQQSGRLDLADWLTRPTNPLTARVMVNRIWQGHFGKGIVSTPNDFGTRGAKPTHPELLDYLASAFIREHWSLKAMHRLILSSAAYQQAPEAIQENKHADVASSNASPFPFPRRRLEAEELRDTLLFLSGELDRDPGHEHPFPAENSNFTQHNPFKAVYDSRKRSVYLMTQRIQRHPFLALFDGPDANASTPERGNSTVPTQALYFLNDPFFHARAEALARNLLKRPDANRIEAAHVLCFQRQPSSLEQAQADRFFKTYRSALPAANEDQKDLLVWSAYVRTLLASNELLYLD